MNFYKLLRSLILCIYSRTENAMMANEFSRKVFQAVFAVALWPPIDENVDQVNNFLLTAARGRLFVYFKRSIFAKPVLVSKLLTYEYH